MKSASGSMSSDENGLEGGTISSDEKEMKSTSGSMSSDENGSKGDIISSDEKQMKCTSGIGMEIQVFWNENNSKKKHSHYSN